LIPKLEVPILTVVAVITEPGEFSEVFDNGVLKEERREIRLAQVQEFLP
jgi:hypothetical protein